MNQQIKHYLNNPLILGILFVGWLYFCYFIDSLHIFGPLSEGSIVVLMALLIALFGSFHAAYIQKKESILAGMKGAAIGTLLLYAIHSLKVSMVSPGESILPTIASLSLLCAAAVIIILLVYLGEKSYFVFKASHDREVTQDTSGKLIDKSYFSGVIFSLFLITLGYCLPLILRFPHYLGSMPWHQSFIYYATKGTLIFLFGFFYAIFKKNTMTNLFRFKTILIAIVGFNILSVFYPPATELGNSYMINPMSRLIDNLMSIPLLFLLLYLGERLYFAFKK